MAGRRKEQLQQQSQQLQQHQSQQEHQQHVQSEEELYQKLLLMDKNEVFELTLKEVGGFGLFHVILWCVGLLSCFVAAFNHMGIIFIAYSPEYSCAIDGIHTLGLQENANSSIFKESTSESGVDKRCYVEEDIACKRWHYDQSIFRSTIVTEFDLVCDRLPLLPVIISSYMIGIIFINTICGFLSDRFGRRRMALIFTVVHIGSSFATAFATNYVMFMGFHVLVGSSIHSVWSSLFVLTTEVMPEPKRVANGAVFNFGWNIGAILMTALAYWLREWNHLQLAFAVISLGLISIYFLVPESPRWLLQHGRAEEAEANFKLMARRNRKDLEKTGFEIHFRVLKDDPNKTAKDKLDNFREDTFLSRVREYISTAVTLLKKKEFCKRLFLMMIVWITVGCSAYGIHFSAKFVHYNVFVTTAIKEVVVIVTILILIPIYERTNRPACIMIFYLIAGFLGISFLLIPAEAATARVVLYVLCQAVMSGDFYLVDTYTPDMFSTDTRNFAFSLLDAISKTGTTISPFIVDLGGDQNPNVPPAVFGILMIVASVAFLFTPNTKGQPLVQTVDDLEWTKGRSIFATCRRNACGRETLV